MPDKMQQASARLPLCLAREIVVTGAFAALSEFCKSTGYGVVADAGIFCMCLSAQAGFDIPQHL